MVAIKNKLIIRTCIDCGSDISSLHHNAKRCEICSKKRKQQQDQRRHEENQCKKLKWLFFVEDPVSKVLSHRNAKGSKLRYWLDKICKELTVQDLDFLLTLWNWRVKDTWLTLNQKREYRTCAGIVRDWRDYFLINNTFDNISFDAETGIIFNKDGTYLTVDFDEDMEVYLVRNSDGIIICRN